MAVPIMAALIAHLCILAITIVAPDAWSIVPNTVEDAGFGSIDPGGHLDLLKK